MPDIIRILVFDDDAPHRQYVRAVFRARGYECEEAETPDDVARLLAAQSFDVALVELVNSYGLPEAVFEACKKHGVPCIVATALSEVVARRYCPENMPILTKPLDLKVLNTLLDDAVVNTKAAGVQDCEVLS